ncbi:MAG: glycosyltransferase family 39 protein [Thaumarchaeota archaeon]|nr:glycosyltransferase family 39 protein [Nitrososphaerota archaeon]
MRLSIKALLVASAIQIILVGYRTVLLTVTGYLTSDEANYAVTAMQGGIYGTRYFFGWFNIAIFRLFGVHDLPTFEALFPFYLAFWVLGFLIVAYKILGLLTDNERTKALVLLSISFLPTFSLHSAEFISEQVALTMGAFGFYAWLRFDKDGKDWKWLAFSAVAFVCATYTRTEYGMFLLVGSAYFIYRARLKALPFVLIALLIVVPVPQGGGSNATQTAVNLIGVIIQIPNISPPTSGSTGTGGTITMTSTGPPVITVTNQSQIPHGSPPPGNSNYAPVALNPIGFIFWTLVLFGLGSVGAFGLFGVLAAGAFRLKTDGENALFVASVAMFLVVAAYDSQWYKFYTSQGVGTLIRYANPMVLGFLVVAVRGWESFGWKKGAALFVVSLVTLGAASPVVLAKAQGNLGLNYSVTSMTVYEPLQARNWLLSQSSCIISGNVWVPSSYSAGCYVNYSDGTLFIGVKPPMSIYINNDWKVGLLDFRDIGYNVYPSATGSIGGAAIQNLFNKTHSSPFFIASTVPVDSNCTIAAANMGYNQDAKFFIQAFCIWPHTVILNSSTGSLTEVFPP